MIEAGWSLGLAAAGAGLLVGSWTALRRRRAAARAGALVRVETDGPLWLRSERYRLLGRPDELRRTPDGAIVPVELKHRPVPVGGPFYSHTVQVWGYCALVEETTGRAPPFGVLRYTDGERTVPWNPAARIALEGIRRRALGPYDGAADPSVGKCSVCAWSERCDASLASGRRLPRAA